MEVININESEMNIENFSKMVGTNLNISSDILRNYIFANISMSLIRNSNMRNDISKLYNLDKRKYYDSANNSSCINHNIIKQGTLEQEILARKALGILLVSEEDFNLRNKLIKLLRKYYPIVYSSIKQHNLKILKDCYKLMDSSTREIESRYHSSIYFYFSIYRSADFVDQGCISSIINDMYDYEFGNFINSNIDLEITKYKPQIDEIKNSLKKAFGKINSMSDILSSNIKIIKDCCSNIENLFISNKLNVNCIFNTSEFLNIDKILLSYIKNNNKNINSETIIQPLVYCIFTQSLINEYKTIRELFLKNDRESLLFQLDYLKENLYDMEVKNTNINKAMFSLQQEKASFDKNLNDKINNLNKSHISEINSMQNKIEELEKQLSKEKKYRNELYALREYIFQVNNDYIPSYSENTFESYIKNKKILIIGGSKEWRRKFRDIYPQIRTLHGFNENFDTSVLNSYEYIFFYTGFINHATYYKAMNYIRSHQIKFGYIGKTNVNLVKEELMEELQKLN